MMRHSAIAATLLVALCTVLTAGHGLAATAIVGVRVEAPPTAGALELLLFDNANAFGDVRAPVYRARHRVDGPGVYTLPPVPPGEYALLVYLDENDNSTLDRNFIGIPVEPLGFSNGYQPKGPPQYHRAAFALGAAETKIFPVRLRLPLGKRGRIGLGPGLIARSTPYRGAHGLSSQPIPAVTYIGSRLQILGPRLQFELLQRDPLGLAAQATYRMGSYEEADSAALRGMGDRKDTVLAGLALNWRVGGGVEVSAGYRHDALGRIGGGEGSVGIDKAFQTGILRLTPEISANWVSAELNHHDFGVPRRQARSGRPAYSPGATVSVAAGLTTFAELTADWSAVLHLSLERLAPEVRASPIVDADYVASGFAAVSYLF